MPLKKMLILTAPADRAARVRSAGLTPGHRAYRAGRGGHLFRIGQPIPLRGGLMVVDAKGFDGHGSAEVLCREILQECAAREFSGVICDFPGTPLPILEQTAAQLDATCARRHLSLYVPQTLAPCTQHAHIPVNSALSGGSLECLLEESARRFGGPERLALAVERAAEDFFLPAPDGCGRPLSRAELATLMDRLAPSVFFSDELCARYFTYMDRDSGAHFVLFDDAMSIRKKLLVARRAGVTRAVAELSDVDDLLDELTG